mgnify:CR=1 FL=1
MNQYEALLANMQEFGDYSPAAMEALAKAKKEVEAQASVPTKYTWRASFRKTPAQKPEPQTQTVTQPKETLMSIDPNRVRSIAPNTVTSVPQNTNTGESKGGQLLLGWAGLLGGATTIGGLGYGSYQLGKESMNNAISATNNELQKMTGKYNWASNQMNKVADQLDEQTRALNKANVYGKQMKTRYNNLKSSIPETKPISFDFKHSPELKDMNPEMVKEQINQALSARGIALNPSDVTKPVWGTIASTVTKRGRKTAVKEGLPEVVSKAIKSF